MVATMPATRAELVQQAAALVPKLRERAERAEQLRRLPDETIGELTDAGLYRIGNPDRLGGLGPRRVPLTRHCEVRVYWRLQ